MEICYIEAGRLSWWVEDERYEVVGGDVYITWPDEAHGSLDISLDPSRLYWIIFDLPRRPSRGYLGLSDADARALTAGMRSLSRRTFPGTALVLELFRGLYSTALDAPDAGLLLRSGLVRLMLACKQAAGRDVPRESVSSPVRESIALMDAHLEQPLCLDELAVAVGWSLPHFKARFRREINVAPGQFYLRRRVGAAVEAIRRTDRPLLEIALRYGFSSSQYLATCVKRFTGRTPMEHRAAAGDAD